MFIDAQNVSLNYQNTIGSINLINNTMTVKELKEKLNEYPDNMDVYLYSTSEFPYGFADEVHKKKLTFSENVAGKVMGSDEVVVIEDI